MSANKFMFFLIVWSCIPTTKTFSQQLYPVREKNLWGFINDNGEMMIEPQFFSVGNFAEGLAPARNSGMYGFIDSTGKFVIQPQFHFASAFEGGIAEVKIDTNVFYVTSSGKKILEDKSIYPEIFRLYNSNGFIVKTHSRKYGVMNFEEKLLLDTIYSFISEFSNGYFNVAGFNHFQKTKTGSFIKEIGVIDSLGKFVVPYGKYQEIDLDHDFYYAIHSDSLEFNFYELKPHSILNSNFELVLEIPSHTHILQANTLKDSLLFFNKTYTNQPQLRTCGAMDLHGNILFEMGNCEQLTRISSNRSFVRRKHGSWIMIDNNGNQITNKDFEFVITQGDYPDLDLFKKGFALVKMNNRYVVIDSMCNELNTLYMPNTRPGMIHLNDSGKQILSLSRCDENSYKIGFWDFKNNLLVEPKFDYLKWDGFDGNLIRAKEGPWMSYIDGQGNYVWREIQNSKVNWPCNKDYIQHVIYNSKYLKLEEEKIDSIQTNKSRIDDQSNVQEKLQILVQQNADTKYFESCIAIKVQVKNATNDTIQFETCRTNLDMRLEAQQTDGNWKFIQGPEHESYDENDERPYLPPHTYWEFTSPIYEGSLKTKLRFRLAYFYPTSAINDNKMQNKKHLLYSKEFEGSVNPGQFWNHQRN